MEAMPSMREHERIKSKYITIKINGKKVVIIGKNARAYEKMNGFLPDKNDVEVYVEAAVHPSDIKAYNAGLDESTLAELHLGFGLFFLKISIS